MWTLWGKFFKGSRITKKESHPDGLGWLGEILPAGKLVVAKYSLLHFFIEQVIGKTAYQQGFCNIDKLIGNAIGTEVGRDIRKEYIALNDLSRLIARWYELLVPCRVANEHHTLQIFSFSLRGRRRNGLPVSSLSLVEADVNVFFTRSGLSAMFSFDSTGSGTSAFWISSGSNRVLCTASKTVL